ncbi:MAG: basic amino acid ABC transporter substrate-binding protein [Clostridiales bacterium]|nr:basic amino acid ABC transporter substrate-binding protein [Clostridiales bacterium]
MKKILAMILATMMVLGCVGAVAEGDFVMATNAEFAPFEYKEDDGSIIGFDIEIAAEIAKDLGKTLKIEDMAFASVVPAVQTGKADIGIAAMTITDERLANVDFSTPYFIATQACITKDGSVVVDAESLKDKKIGVQEGTTGQVTAETFTAVENVSAFAKAIDAVTDLKNGKIDAVIVDLPVAKNILTAMNDATLIMLDIEFEAENYGIAIKKGNAELVESINATLARITEDGTLDAITAKYFEGVAE